MVFQLSLKKLLESNTVYRMSILAGVWMLVFAVLIIVKPEIIAFLFAGFLFFVGIATISTIIYLKKLSAEKIKYPLN